MSFAFTATWAKAETMNLVITDVFWQADLTIVAEAPASNPTNLKYILVTGLKTPTIATAAYKWCDVKDELKTILTSQLKQLVGKKLTTQFESKILEWPYWRKNGFRYRVMLGEHTFEDGETLRSKLLENSAAISHSDDPPASWFKDPECINYKRDENA